MKDLLIEKVLIENKEDEHMKFDRMLYSYTSEMKRDFPYLKVDPELSFVIFCSNFLR